MQVDCKIIAALEDWVVVDLGVAVAGGDGAAGDDSEEMG